MNRKAFTLVELLAALSILGILLTIAVPNITNLINNSTKQSFKLDAEGLCEAIKVKKMKDESFDVTSVNEGTVFQLLNLPVKNYETVEVKMNDNLPYLSIVGKNDWEGLVACGADCNMVVVNSLSDCNSDLTPPLIEIIGSSNVDINIGDSYTDAGATATDNVDGDITSRIVSSGTLNPSVPGTYTITYTVSDIAGNTATVTRTVNVVDNIGPTVDFTPNGNSTYAKNRSVTINIEDISDVDDSSLRYVWTSSTTEPIYDDINATFTNGGAISSPAGATGSYYLWLRAKDTIGNQTIARSSFFNLDNIAPVITMNGSNPVTISKGSTYTDAGATATDNIDTSVTVTSSGTVNTSIIGTYTITYNATDSLGNTATPVVRTINVVDVSAPVITISGDNPIAIEVGSTYSDAGATAVDTVDGDLTSNINITSNVNPNIVGSYTVTYTVSDTTGNTANATRTVNVVAYQYSSSEGVNKPKLATGMVPIKWDGSTWVDTTESDVDWYGYDTTNKRWANARTADGSMWVWIPRYAYKISSGWHTNTTGTIDIQFSMGTDDTRGGTVSVITESTSNASNGTWSNHPTFTFGSTELTGIWVAKFEATAAEGVANGDTSDNSCPITGDNDATKAVKILPNVLSWRCIQIEKAFNAARNMESNSVYGWATASTLKTDGTYTTDTNNIDTHLIKNIEWGAVAYLSKSPYGKNTEEIYINNNSNFMTGCAGNTITTGFYNGCQNTYESTGGVKASTTGNVYGIYDMSGGANEYVSAYLNNGNGDLLQGESVTGAIAKYKDVYTKGTTDDQASNYALAINQKGDAIYETSSTTNGAYSWFGDDSYMVSGNNPWFLRGNYYGAGFSAGIFSISTYWGGAGSSYGFRPVLLVNTGL